MDLSTRFARNSQIAFRTIEDEVMAVDPGKGVVYVFNGVGSRIWELLKSRSNTDDIIGTLAHEYAADVPMIESDVTSFLQDLLDKGLLSIV
jgi:hypothetical protein